MAHCHTCLYNCLDTDNTFSMCNNCFAFSNYCRADTVADKIKQIVSPLSTEEEQMRKHLTNTLGIIEPAYVTYMGHTFESHDINIRIGGLNDYSTFNVEFTNSPTNLVGAFGPTPQIEDIIFNPPATIVFWKDGTKTVVRAQGDDIYDPEKGIAIAISKKILGNKYDYYHTFAKYLKKWNKHQEINNA